MNASEIASRLKREFSEISVQYSGSVWVRNGLLSMVKFELFDMTNMITVRGSSLDDAIQQLHKLHKMEAGIASIPVGS